MTSATVTDYEPVFLPGIVNEPWAHRQTLSEYREQGGYQQVQKALGEMEPAQVVDFVKESGIRGRGGAGFPAGVKWGFLPPTDGKPRYLACNCDESEPGTCKDRFIVEQKPHLLLEGMAICCYAAQISKAYIYIRGEYFHGARTLQDAIDELKAEGKLGENAFGKEGFNLDFYVHRGAGAYICGEESALMESLEGKRGYPRMKPPFPAIKGLWQRPTVINNVGTLASLPLIFEKGNDWFKGLGREKTSGFLVYCVSGHVQNPGNYELPSKVKLRELLDAAGGIKDGREMKAVIPGGASMPIFPLTEEHREEFLDVVMDFEGVREAGSLLGSAGIIVMDDRTCMVTAAHNISHFFKHESCGQCTPCREGTGWIYKTMSRIVKGEGRIEDVDILASMSPRISGRSICALGEAATGVLASTIKYFRDEFEYYIENGKSKVGTAYREFK
jgi:NADH-quinone oxidoreductase subunit F